MDGFAPLVVAVEGPCYAGKTTLTAAVARALRATVAPEYADLAPLPPFPPRGQRDVTVALRHFLQLDRDRAAYARAAQRAVVLCDRSPLTLITYEIAMAELDVPHDPHAAVSMFCTAAADGAILTPDAYLYVTVEPSVAAARSAARGPVAAHLADPHVQHALDRASRCYLDRLPASRCLYLDGAAALSHLVIRTVAFITALQHGPHRTLPAWHTLLQHVNRLTTAASTPS